MKSVSKIDNYEILRNNKDDIKKIIKLITACRMLSIVFNYLFDRILNIFFYN